jgi:Reverse transcriptase (RNA-dependent DNA polymerase)
VGQTGLRPSSAGGFRVSNHYIATSQNNKPHNERNGILVNDSNKTQDNDLGIPRGYKCTCGKVVSTNRGLKIHMTKMGCGKGGGVLVEQRIQPGTPGGSKSVEEVSPVDNHSANIPLVRDAPREASKKVKVKWPKMVDEDSWKRLEKEVCSRLWHDNGNVEERLKLLSETIYGVSLEMFGEEEIRQLKPKVVVSRRQETINRLRKEKNILKRRWKESVDHEKQAINELVKDVRRRLVGVLKVERLVRKRKERKVANDKFVKNPFVYARGLLDAKKSGSLAVQKEELDQYIKKSYGSAERNTELGPTPIVNRPSTPGREFCLVDIQLKEIEEVVRKARAKSSAGPNGVSYKVFKKCAELRKKLWGLLKVAWRKKVVHPEWQIADGVFIPKEEKSVELSQFRPIALMNVEGKIFFSVLAKRVSTFVLENGYIDTTIQKAGIPGFSGCLEHSCVIWELIKRAKVEKRDLAVIWLDLVNAYGSVPHKLVEFAMDFFWVPEEVIKLVMKYFDGFVCRYSAGGVTSEWQRLEVGIAMGCAISPILFVLVMEVVLRAGSVVSKGIEMSPGCTVPALRAFMDDITVLEQGYKQAKVTLDKLDEVVCWGRMKFKPVKCRSLLFKGGRVVEKEFKVSGEIMPSVKQQGVKSLGRWYKYPVSDRGRSKEFSDLAESGLRAIDRAPVRGKWKCWCYHHVLLPRLLWPLLVYEIPLSRVEAVEKRINGFLRKWLGVPRCLSSIALYNKSMCLQLPFTSLAEEYKVGKVRLHLMLSTSADRVTRMVEPELGTGKIWSVVEAVKDAESRVRFEGIKGNVQIGKSGLGWRRWAFKHDDHKTNVCRMVREREEETRVVKVAQMSTQGRLSGWEDVIERKLTWNDLWKVDAVRIGFLLKSVFDCLPSGRNLRVWNYAESDKCMRCQEVENIEHVLCACKVFLSEGRYTWRHNQVLRVMKEIVSEGVKSEGNLPPIAFVQAGEKPKQERKKLERKEPGWELLVDLEKRLVFPSEIVVTNLRPDMVLMNKQRKKVVLVELTVPWEDRMSEAHYRKVNKYEALRQSCEDTGWEAQCYAVEVGCRGFVGASMRRFLVNIGVRGNQLREGLESLAVAAEKASAWVWLKRNDVWQRGGER